MANTVLATGYPSLVRNSEDAFGKRHRSYTFDFNPSSTYGTGGGILVSPNLVGVSSLVQIELVELEDVSTGGPAGYIYLWNQATGAIQFFETAAGTPTESFSYLDFTNIAETSGSVVTLSCSNSLPTGGGSVVSIGVLTTGTWLNGLTVVTTSATSSTIVFADPTSHGSESSSSTSGWGTVTTLSSAAGALTEIGNISVSNVIVRARFITKP